MKGKRQRVPDSAATASRRIRALAAAWADYQSTSRELDALRQCDSHWPRDLPGPDYPGTRCDRIADGHTAHRHRVEGSSVTVTW